MDQNFRSTLVNLLEKDSYDLQLVTLATHNACNSLADSEINFQIFPSEIFENSFRLTSGSSFN